MVLALPVEGRGPPLETNTRPPLQLKIVKRPTRTAAGQDQHTGSYQLMPDMVAGLAYHEPAVMPAASARMSSWPLAISRSSAIDWRSWRKSKLAILSVTLHHHPQGQKVHPA